MAHLSNKTSSQKFHKRRKKDEELNKLVSVYNHDVNLLGFILWTKTYPIRNDVLSGTST